MFANIIKCLLLPMKKNVRNIKRSNPKDCELVKDETFNYLFDLRAISAGSLWYCN